MNIEAVTTEGMRFMLLENLDDYDVKILNLVKEDARLSYTQIGEQVNLSRVSVRKRMENMEQMGIIKGYHAVVDETASQNGVKFFMNIETQPDYYESVLERLSYEPKIRQVYETTGSCRVYAVGYASNTKDAGYLIRTLFGNRRGIVRLDWDILASVVKDVDGGVRYERIKREKDNSIKSTCDENSQ